MKKKGKVVAQSSLSSIIQRSRVLPKDPSPRFSPAWSSGDLIRSNEANVLHDAWTGNSPVIVPVSLDLVLDLVRAAKQISVPTKAIFGGGEFKRLVDMDHNKNNDPASPYYIQWPECKEIQIETVDEMNSLLKLQETKILLRSPPIFTLVSRDNQPRVHMRSSMDSSLAVPLCRWLTSHLPSVESLSAHLQIMSKEALMPLKSSNEGVLVIQASGRSRILLIPPSLESLAPFCRSHPLHRYSAVGMAATASCKMDPLLVKHVADLWPHSTEIKGMSCILSAGEALFVPPEFSLHRESLLETSVSLIVTLKTSAPLSPMASLVSAAFIIERWVDHEVGVSGSRGFLQSLIDMIKRHEEEMEAFVGSISVGKKCGEEVWESVGKSVSSAPPRHWTEAWPLDTVKGCKSIRLAMEIYEVCVALVDIDPSIKKPHRVLQALIEGRMLHTTWLNEYGIKQNQVPSNHLSLTWNYPAPKLEESEAAFPALFSRQIKLKEDRASKEAHEEREKQLMLQMSSIKNALQ